MGFKDTAGTSSLYLPSHAAERYVIKTPAPDQSQERHGNSEEFQAQLRWPQAPSQNSVWGEGVVLQLKNLHFSSWVVSIRHFLAVTFGNRMKKKEIEVLCNPTDPR